MKVTEILKRPLITEKATLLKETGGSVLFAVDPRANKKQIREAVEALFKVKVVDVKTMNVPGKIKRRAKSVGRRPGWKKAVVVLRQGDHIEFFEGV
jgi:large subunit ribosomal protein L23